MAHEHWRVVENLLGFVFTFVSVICLPLWFCPSTTQTDNPSLVFLVGNITAFVILSGQFLVGYKNVFSFISGAYLSAYSGAASLLSHYFENHDTQALNLITVLLVNVFIQMCIVEIARRTKWPENERALVYALWTVLLLPVMAYLFAAHPGLNLNLLRDSLRVEDKQDIEKLGGEPLKNPDKTDTTHDNTLSAEILAAASIV